MDRDHYNRLKAISKMTSWHIKEKLEEFLKEVEPKSTRSLSQNNSIHFYLTQVARTLQEDGHTMQDVVKAIRRAEIMPTMLALKEVVWKPLQKIITGKESTTKIEKLEVDQVYEAVNKFFSKDPFCVHIPFPNDDKKDTAGIKSLGYHK